RLVVLATVVAAVVVVAAALLGVGIVWWSGATLSADRTALARIELQPLAGSVRSITAFGPDGTRIPIASSHDRLTPTELVASNAEVRVVVVVRRPRWLGWLAGRSHRETLRIRTPSAKVADRWPTLTRAAALDVRFGSRVDYAVVRGLGSPRTIHVGGRVLPL